MIQIDPKEVQFREYEDPRRGYYVVIASARYAAAVTVYEETIHDIGPLAMEMARAQALETLLRAPQSVPIGNEIWKEPLHLPPIKTGEEKPRC